MEHVTNGSLLDAGHCSSSDWSSNSRWSTFMPSSEPFKLHSTLIPICIFLCRFTHCSCRSISRPHIFNIFSLHILDFSGCRNSNLSASNLPFIARGDGNFEQLYKHLLQKAVCRLTCCRGLWAPFRHWQIARVCGLSTKYFTLKFIHPVDSSHMLCTLLLPLKIVVLVACQRTVQYLLYYSWWSVFLQNVEPSYLATANECTSRIATTKGMITTGYKAYILGKFMIEGCKYCSVTFSWVYHTTSS